MDEPTVARAPKACINCRKQKMKCRMDHDETCRRCRRAGLPCVFVPRANAAGPWKLHTEAQALPDTLSAEFGMHLLRRVKAIEAHIGLSNDPDTQQEVDDSPEAGDAASTEEDRRLEPLWQAAACLEKCNTGPHNPALWQRPIVKHLFQTFHQKMPGLHFLPDKQKYWSPYPLLLAAILYCSSVRGSREVADLAPQYFTALCSAISQLSIPGSEISTVPKDAAHIEEWAFQTVLGLVLAGLLAEGGIRETGIWISIAYRLMLEYYPPYSDERRHDWRKLFNGVQIVDLEHASLHLLSPVIPLEPPIASLRTSHRDQLYRLSRIMHTGLAHFAGRGLPTIWSCFADDTATTSPTISSVPPFTAVDAALMRDWARQLDDWLDEFTKATDETCEDRRTVFRQYVLHRLVVLSIYHPARGCNLHSNSMTPKEQRELLLSARATIKLHIHDKTIWSNWDIVMITWATLIVIQGVEGGAGEPDDLKNIRAHLASLKETNEPGLSLRERLAIRLEKALENIRTPDLSTTQQYSALDNSGISPDFDRSWQIFNQGSLDQVNFPEWPTPTDLHNASIEQHDMGFHQSGPLEPIRPW